MVSVKDAVVADNGKILSLCLSDQHSVEGIAMFAG
jgi:hypothetical protein